MKIVQAVNTVAVADGGPARNSTDLNIALNRVEGVEAQLLWLRGDLAESVLADRAPHAPALAVPGPQRVGLRDDEGARTWSPARSLEVLEEADAVVIHGFYLPWIPPLAAWARRRRIPYVIMPHGSLTAYQQETSRLKKRVFDATAGRVVLGGLGAFATGSEPEAEELRRLHPGIHATAVGVGTYEHSDVPHASEPHDPVRLLTMSRLAPKKRVDLAIDTVAELRRRGRRAVLRVAGTGSEREALARHGEKSGVAGDVEFVGQVGGAAKTELYLGSDVFLLPSEDENFGIGLAEAQAYGVPCVTTTKVAAAELLPQGCGRVLDHADGASLADAVEQIVAPGEYGAQVTAASSAARDVYSWDAVARRWCGLLTEVVESRRA